MRLSVLEAELVTLIEPTGWKAAEDVASASGLIMLCPGCFEKNGGAVGTHSALLWFRARAVPTHLQPGPGRWYATGTSIENLSLTPSVVIGDPACWHGWIRAGETTNA
jgi:hypothetical protein